MNQKQSHHGQGHVPGRKPDPAQAPGGCVMDWNAEASQSESLPPAVRFPQDPTGSPGLVGPTGQGGGLGEALRPPPPPAPGLLRCLSANCPRVHGSSPLIAGTGQWDGGRPHAVGKLRTRLEGQQVSAPPSREEEETSAAQGATGAATKSRSSSRTDLQTQARSPSHGSALFWG